MRELKKKTDAPKALWAAARYPVGVVYCAVGGRGVTDLWISPAADDAAFEQRLLRAGRIPSKDAAALKEVFNWLDGYFRGLSRPFPLGLDPAGTEFEKAVWKAVSVIPRGSVRTYGEVASDVKKPNGARAVGGACGKNPIPVIVPCHRVVSGRGAGGYTGGPDIKKALLLIEGVVI